MKHFVSIVLLKPYRNDFMFKKNKKDTGFFEKKMNEQKEIHDKLFKQEKENLEKIIKSEKYNVDSIISRSNLGNVYHDLIDSKDQFNSEYQTKFNQAYHSVDIELRKINKIIDNESKMINYRYNTKKGQVLSKVLTTL